MNRIQRIHVLLDELAENDNFSEEFDKLSEELFDINPMDDMFHLGCKSWPCCDVNGCH